MSFSWSDCSRSCGGGIRRSERACDRPTPKHGGLHCIGDRKRYESCETFECEIGSSDFRLEQCQQVMITILSSFLPIDPEFQSQPYELVQI